MPISGPIGTASQLNYTAPGSGVGISVQAKLAQAVNIRDYGGLADYAGGGIGTGADNLIAIHEISTQYGANARVVFDALAGLGYRISAGDAQIGSCILDVDPKCTLYFDGYPGYVAGFTQVKCVRPVNCISLDLNYAFVIGDSAAKTLVDKGVFLTEANFDRATTTSVITNGTELVAQNIPWPAGDTFVVDTTWAYSAADTKSVHWTANVNNDVNFHLAWRNISPGCSLNMNFSGAIGTTPLLCLAVKATGGWAGVFFSTEVNGTSTTYIRKDIGVTAISTPIAYPAKVTHQSYSPYFSHGSVRVGGYDPVTDLSNFDILFSGNIIAKGQVRGVIYKAGAGMYGQTGAGATFDNWTITRFKEPGGAAMISTMFIGDSRMADRVDSFPQYYREFIEGTAGSRAIFQYNQAVAGHTSAQQLAVLTAAGVPGTAGGPVAPFPPNVVIIDASTNDIQGFGIGTTLTGNTIPNYDAMIAFIEGKIGAGLTKYIIGIPFLWYTQAQNGGHGQNSGQYASGAVWRAGLMRYAADRGYSIMDWNEILGPITSNFDNGFPTVVPQLNSNLPAVQDDIHPSSWAARLMGFALARRVAGLFTARIPKSTGWITVPTASYVNAWAQFASEPLQYRIDAEGFVHFRGVVTAGTLTDGTSALQLPNILLPDRATVRVLLPFDLGGSARFELSNPNCLLTIFNKAGAGTTNVFFDGFAPYKIANGDL